MTTPTTTVAHPDPIRELEVVALDPGQLASAQADLIAWCDAKKKDMRRELREVEANLKIAVENKWRVSGLRHQVTLIRKRVDFYEKIHTALKAGYIIVPNFPVDFFAVRTAAIDPVGYHRPYRGQQPDQPAQVLPISEGRYISPIASESSFVKTQKDAKTGEQKPVTLWCVEAFQNPVFPVRAVKPVVLEATARAMALRLFDRIGVVGVRTARRRLDPIVIGQIIDPRSTQYTSRVVSFFVAWWLDTRSL